MNKITVNGVLRFLEKQGAPTITNASGTIELPDVKLQEHPVEEGAPQGGKPAAVPSPEEIRTGKKGLLLRAGTRMAGWAARNPIMAGMFGLQLYGIAKGTGDTWEQYDNLVKADRQAQEQARQMTTFGQGDPFLDMYNAISNKGLTDYERDVRNEGILTANIRQNNKIMRQNRLQSAIDAVQSSLGRGHEKPFSNISETEKYKKEYGHGSQKTAETSLPKNTKNRYDRSTI